MKKTINHKENIRSQWKQCSILFINNYFLNKYFVDKVALKKLVSFFSGILRYIPSSHRI